VIAYRPVGFIADHGLPTGDWRVDTVHSTARFSVSHHRVATFRGGFRDISGELASGVLAGSVRVGSIELPGPAVFKEQLLAAEWFEAAAFPEIAFQSNLLRAAGGSVSGTGTLTLRAASREVQLHGQVRGPLEVTQESGVSRRLGLELSTVIDRREFGIMGDGGAGWMVTLDVALELVER
jgi:polyisoprenoid-binding protein YceI